MIKKRHLATLLVCLMAVLFLFGLTAFIDSEETAPAQADVTADFELADEITEWVFTDSKALLSKWGNQEATTVIDDEDLTMRTKANQAIEGTRKMGSYHTKFDIEFANTGSWWSMMLRQNSGTLQNVNGVNIDTGAESGFKIFIQNQYLQTFEITDGAQQSMGTFVFDSSWHCGDETWYTFEIWVLNLKDGTVQIIMDINGTRRVNVNRTTDYKEGYFRFSASGSNVATNCRGYRYEGETTFAGTPKTEFKLGESFDAGTLTALVPVGGLTVSYPVTEDMVSGFDNMQMGEQELTVVTTKGEYKYNVTVTSSSRASYTLLDDYQKVYSVGEEYRGDVKFERLFDGETTIVTVTADMLTGFTTALGTNENEMIATVVFTEEKEELVYEIPFTVVKEVVGIDVSGIGKIQSAVGRTFDYTSLKGKLKVTFNDGTTEAGDISPSMLSQKGAYEGENIVTVTYEGFTDSFIVEGTGESVWDANAEDKELRASLPELNIADPRIMDMTGSVTTAGASVKFGPSSGSWIGYGTKSKYSNYRISFDSVLSNKLTNANQRFALRATSVDNNSLYGYMLIFYANNLQIFRKPLNDDGSAYGGSGYMLKYFPLTDAMAGNNGVIYDGVSRHFVIEVYDRSDGNVVINVGIDGVQALQFVDSPSVSSGSIPAEHQKVFSDAGYVGFMMNSGGAAWELRGEFTDSVFEADTYLGNPDLYTSLSTANIATGSIGFDDGQKAVAAEEATSFNAAFKLSFSSVEPEKVLFSVGTFGSRRNRADYEAYDGILIDIYSDKAEIRYNDRVLAVLTGFTVEVEREIEFKVSVVAFSETFIATVGTNGVYAYASVEQGENSSGYFALFSFAPVKLFAESDAERNFRVLFIGNSITSHGPSTDLNYTIGTGTMGAETWGMATSEPQYDYVHRVVATIRELPGYENTEFMAINCATWEQNYATYNYASVYYQGAAFEADLIIGRLGENAASTTAAYQQGNNFTYYYEELLRYFNSKGTAQIVLTTSYWGNENYNRDNLIDGYIVEAARRNDWPLVRLGDLGSKYKSINDATADEEYYKALESKTPGGLDWATEFSNWTTGVKMHPGMVGHENIAARISESVVKLLTGGDAYISKYKQVADGLYVEYTSTELTGNAKGAYDYRSATNIEFSEFTEVSEYAFADGYYCLRAFDISADGDIYRVTMTLDEDTTAPLTFRVYTLNASGELVELSYYNNAENSDKPVLSVSGDFGSKLFFCFEYAPEKIFVSEEWTSAKYGTILKAVNERSEDFVLDVSGLGYDTLTLGYAVYPSIISSGKDLVIEFAHGTVRVERKTFETICKTTDNLFFSVQSLTGANYLKNATAAVNALDGDYWFISENENGQPNEVYEMQISYNGRSGEALYVNRGIVVTLSIELTEKQAKGLTVITAVLPAIGSSVKNVRLLDPSRYSYANGVLTLELSDFDNDIILAVRGEEATLTVKDGYIAEYEVGDSLSVENMTLVYTDIRGESREVAVTADMVSGFDSSSAGDVELTISYGGLTVKVSVSIKGKTEPGDSSDSASSDNSSSDSVSSDSGNSSDSGASDSVVVNDGGCGGCKGILTGLTLPVLAGVFVVLFKKKRD